MIIDSARRAKIDMWAWRLALYESLNRRNPDAATDIQGSLHNSTLHVHRLNYTLPGTQIPIENRPNSINLKEIYG